jgi:hypothetical protein
MKPEGSLSYSQGLIIQCSLSYTAKLEAVSSTSVMALNAEVMMDTITQTTYEKEICRNSLWLWNLGFCFERKP